MKVFVVLEDLGCYDGGANIADMFAQEADAIAFRDREQAKAGTYPEYRIQEHEINFGAMIANCVGA